MIDTNILFETVVGSHAWNMNKPTSDIDIFQIYQVPTKDILSGILRQNSHFTKGEDKDESRHEIGVVIEQLLKGNFNFVVGICSPIVNEDKYGYLKELREITIRNVHPDRKGGTEDTIKKFKKFHSEGKIIFV